jgi:hypothetical protein
LWKKRPKKIKTKIRLNYFDTVAIRNVTYKFAKIREEFIKKHRRISEQKTVKKKIKW